MRKEDPAAAALIPEPVLPDGIDPQPYHQIYWRAWNRVRFDRQYGAFGGESRISFLALDAYAARYGIHGAAFDDLVTVIEALDAEWLAYVAEKTAEKGTS